MAASIHKITKEDVVEVLDILFLTIFMWTAIESEETHQICELTMNISENFQRRFSLKDHGLTHDYFLSQVAKSDDLIRSKCHLQCLRISKCLWLHQSIEEKGSNIHLSIQFFLYLDNRFAFFSTNNRFQKLNSLLLFRNWF